MASLIAIMFASTLISCSGCSKKEEQPVGDSTKTTALPPLPTKKSPAFDGEAAMKSVEKQVDFGPRVPNSNAHDQELLYIQSELAKYTTSVNSQAFVEQGYDNQSLNLTNVIASFNPDATDRIVILTHWDSRPWADEDTVAANKTKPVPAANDGGSGTAVMLELARAMKDDPPPIGVDLLFDDGEDYGKPSVDELAKYFLGAKYFVKNKPDKYFPRFAILLDMVGDKNAVFEPEGNSMKSAARYTTEIWQAARELGLSTFRNGPGSTIEDDHLPFLEAGIPAVDIIDADLVGAHTTDPARKYWHTTHDLPNNLSAKTLDEVGRLLLYLIYEKLPLTIRNP
jgi:Zn-dependent M28 family amino/carboxypeptidase